MTTLKLKNKLPEWRKHFKPNEKVDQRKVDALMKRYYPHLFTTPVPLEAGVHKKLLADPRLPVSRKQARMFLWRWTNMDSYQMRVKAGVDRVAFER